MNVITHTTDIEAFTRFRRDRGDQFCVSGHIRPGEYTAYYAATTLEAEHARERLHRRGCHQIQVESPVQP